VIAMSRYSKRKLQYLPLSVKHFLSLLFTLMVMFPVLYFWFEPAFILGLGISSTVASIILLASLIGSYINIPVFEMRSYQPIVSARYISYFGFNWVIPNLEWREQKTVIAVNVGGAVIPVMFSIYLFIKYVIFGSNPMLFTIKVLVATLIVTLLINRLARPIKGVGIAMPGIVAAIITAITSLIIAPIGGYCNVTVIAYISGTLGALLGADILNLHKIPELGAPVASIGGAGTFDGVFLNGLFSIILILLFIY